MKPYLLLFPALLFLVHLSSCDDDEKKEPVDPCIGASSIGKPQVVADRYIISVPSGQDSNDGRMASKGVSLLRRNNLSEERIVRYFKGKNLHYVLNLSAEEAARLKRDSEVLKIEQDKSVSLCSCFEVVEPSLITWNVSNVGCGDGTGKVAWILDSGVDYDHPDLNVDTERSQSFIPDVATADDDEGHGTHIAGIIGAKNNTIGTLGVASGATIVALKVLDSEGDGFVSYILEALSYVSEHGNPGDAVNLSLSVDNDLSEILDEEVQALGNQGFYVCIAAGNDAMNANNFSPARANGKNIYTVSAVDSLNRFASWSNYGNDVVDYAAPGVRILSTYLNGQYAYIDGTSQAAPHVAGILLVNNGKIFNSGTAINDPDGTPDPLAHR
jgi:subtilisin